MENSFATSARELLFLLNVEATQENIDKVTSWLQYQFFVVLPARLYNPQQSIKTEIKNV